MSETSESKRDRIGSLHQLLQWVSAIMSTVLAAMMISGMDTWEKLNDQRIRMESVPQDVKEIKSSLQEQGRDIDAHTWRLKLIEADLASRPRRHN